MAKQPEQFNPADNIRKELDAKIELKVSNHVFYWAFGILVMALAGLIGYLVKISDGQNSMNLRLAHVEAKTDRADLINDRLVRIETQVESIKPK